MQARRRAQLAAGTALVTLLACELLLFAAERTSGRVAALLHGRALPDARLGERPNPALPDHDAAGWRNAERPPQAFAVAIGDSQTYGDEVAREQAWPQRLAALSGRSVYNLALGGYGPVEYDRLLPEALELSPRVVLVGLYAGNDFADAYLDAYPRALATELRSLDEAVLARISELERGSELKDAWERTRDARKGRRLGAAARWLEPVAERSRLMALARAAGRAFSGSNESRAASSADDLEALRARAAEAGHDLLLPFEQAELSTVFTPAARLAVLDTSDARVEEGLHIALDRILHMAEVCAERCKLAVVAIPTKELVFAAHVHAKGTPVSRAFAELALRETLVWERVRRALDAAGIPLVETLPQLRALLASGTNPYLPDWNGHPDAAGNDAIAEAVLASGVLDVKDDGAPRDRSQGAPRG